MMSYAERRRRKNLRGTAINRPLTELDGLQPVATLENIGGVMVPVLDYTRTEDGLIIEATKEG